MTTPETPREPIAETSIEQSTFEEIYEETPPWDIGCPQPAIVAIADQVKGPVLDAGCGTGEHALLFAAKGHRVIGIDFVEAAVTQARAKAAERGLDAEFQIKDATALGDWKERFASVIDCGLFHCLSDVDQARYVQGLAQVVQPGGRVFLMAFSDQEPGTEGPRRVSRQQLENAFAEGWHVESIEPIQIEVTSQFESRFSQGGPRSWLAVARRNA
jgi:cyclopropane fatty-acyl-phospholipid synthase-like methyltransferase